ncbi:hypothetical protein SAMN05421780_11114 [Flexibacter flexilis DSM 6793]|uniref:Uncharacterized protein n=1 Tax=Flexibacter flexilis DSM 6793 TaxID=927664 RepID=A0A1I1MN17_9BACT|nr:hypothetical protein [Flexibacter flexilis]SFC86857.1 hypothetical protein SAMN05421780_11114 [Flexibacter flexilis DSM 6793]
MTQFIFSTKEVDFFKSALLDKIKEPIAGVLYGKLNDNCLISLTEEEINYLKNVADTEYLERSKGRAFELRYTQTTTLRKIAMMAANDTEKQALVKLTNIQFSLF